MIVADAKDSGRDVPNWLEPDRAQAVAVLKVMVFYSFEIIVSVTN